MRPVARPTDPAGVDTRTRLRYGTAVVLGLATCLTMVCAVAVVHGLTVEYGGGAFAELGALVVGVPVLLALLTVAVLPGASGHSAVAVALGTAAVMVAGGLTADAVGADANAERLLEGSRDVTCNARHAEVRVPAEVDRTWRALPRPAPVYGPIEGTPTSCTAGVAGDGARTFAAYAGSLRDLDGWRVAVDRPERVVVVRDGVRVTVRLVGAPDRLTTVEVAADR